MRLALAVLATLMLGAPMGAAANRPAPPVGAGIFRVAEVDSLGYDDFRKLPADDQLERREEARRWLRRARDRAHASAGAPTATQRQRLLTEAVDACATAAGLVPYLPDAWVAYARHLNALGEYTAADACLAHADHTLRYERSESRRLQLQHDLEAIRARVAYNRGDGEASRLAAEAALAIDEGDDDTRLILVRALVLLERFAEARQAVAGFADSGPVYPHALAVLGVLETRDGNFVRADEVFDRAFEYGMRGAVFDNDRGRLYLEMERYDDAVDAFSDAVESVPSFHEARNNLAVAHRRAGRLEEADRVLQSMLEELPDYGPAHFNRAEVLRAQLEREGDPARARSFAAEAFVHYTAALDAGYDPDLVIQRRASLPADAEDLERAEADLLAMTEDPSVDARVLFLLGRVKKQQGRPDIALRLLDMAEQRGYDAPRLFAEKGEVLARQGDLEGARDALRRAIEGDDGSLVVTRVNLSSVLAQLGDLEGAKAALDAAAALAPDHPLVLQQRDTLAKASAEERE